jgi:hypothetical protein
MSRTTQIVSRFPDFYCSGDSENLFYQFIEVFASMLDDTEEDLIRVMRTHWVNTADNEGSKGFDATKKGDLDKIFGLYLESLGGTALLKQGTRRTGPDGKLDDDLYRTRILGLIQVLKNGASTKTGIVDIVAANLGILPDLPFAQEAKSGIRIIEFLPEITNSDNRLSVALFEDIPQTNDSPVPSVPEFRLHFHDKDNDDQPALPVPLINPRITLPATQQAVQYIGTIKPGDDLYFLSDGGGLHNGVAFQPSGSVILPPGPANLRLEAEVGLPAGLFNNTFFDYSQFNEATIRFFGQFDSSTFDNTVFAYTIPVADLEVRYLRLHPGSFTVRIPWDIPGFSVNIVLTKHTLDRLTEFDVPTPVLNQLSTLLNQKFDVIEKFYNALDQLNNPGIVRPYKDLILRECLFTDKFARFNISPRGQIKTIVDRVKAAGVYAVIAFEKHFFEDQQLAEQLGLVLKQASFDQEMTESNFDIASIRTTSEQQEMSDFFSASGVFNYTSFDTLNRFA